MARNANRWGNAAAALGALLVLGCGEQGSPDGESTGSRYDAAVLAPGFEAELLITGLDQPTSVRFAPDGRIFVAEKQGTILSYAGFGASPVAVADLRTEVYDYWDRGLLDIAVHPEFPGRPYVFALYTLDGKVGDSVMAGTVPRYNDGCTAPGSGCVCAGRLDRIELDPATGTMISKTTLIENWGQQFPSHSIGSLQWGPDGFLYISAGDGASFNTVDYGNLNGNPLGDPPNGSGALTAPSAMGGALRSQVITPPAATPAFPTWYDGKVLRVDPDTMAPLLDPRAVPAPTIVASGLRNPFRMSFRGNTGELWIGDVGWNAVEEINRIPDVTTAVSAPVNFGWPCYEGTPKQGGYQAANLTVCNNLYAANNAAAPFFSYTHSATVAPGDGCGSGGASITGVAYYDGTTFPSQYQGALFFSDYARRCTWYLPPGPGGTPNASGPVKFASGAGAPVQLVMGPDGDIYYADIEGGIGRFHYSSANHPPQAVVTANPTSGATPLSVSFSAASSSDADAGDTLSYSWDLNGDGVFGDATGVTASHVYNSGGTFTARVRVTDNHGATGTASTVITAGADAPVVSIQVLSANIWSTDETITLAGSAVDAEDGAIDPVDLEWQVILQHCPDNVCHAHVIEEVGGLPQISLEGPDHDYPSHLEIVLTATDSDGLIGTSTLVLNPATTLVTLTSDPPGLQLGLNQTATAAPHSMTVIRNSTTTVSAPPDQVLGGTQYTFLGWSDSGAVTHVVHPTTPTLGLTATFTAVGSEQPLAASGTPIAFITEPTGGGNKNLNVIKDGVKPAAGSTDNNQQYDTYTGGAARPSDWVGYSYTTPKLFTRVVFQEGRNFYDGGAFSSLTVQVRSGGVWTNVSGQAITPAYPGLNGVSYESFGISFTPVSGDGIRIFGAPAGAAQFISIAELEVYGNHQAGTPVNAPPTASAGPDKTADLGAAVTLNGSGSDPEGSAITYLWTQTAGTAVTLTGASSATLSFTAPATAQTLTFQLVTNDGTLSSVPDTVDVVVSDPSTTNLASSGTPVALITNPTGGGNKNLNVIKDGVKPAVGSNDNNQQYDTYNGGGPRPEDWIGYTFTSPKLFNRVVFQEGKNFYDGGSFATLTVQVRSGGVWSNVQALVSNPPYAGSNGVNYETFSLTFTPVSGDGIRVFGTPFGSAHFVSIAELEVYGSDQSGPPVNLPPTANAGADRNVNIGSAVSVTGSGADPEGAAITYAWVQTAGTAVTLTGANTATLSFTAPAAPTTLTFQLTTNDGALGSAPDSVNVVVVQPPPTNTAPSANAGADKTADVGTAVSLSGSGSDPEGTAISYLWTQIGGTAVTLTGATTATPSFTAPAAPTTLTFQLTTSDGALSSTPDTVVVTVVQPPPVNLAPTANAGADKNANLGSAVSLNGSGTDPEGAAITYSWTQIGGPVVTLSGAATATASFTAPAAPTTLTFQLVTNDGALSSTPDVVIVTVVDPNTVNLAASGTPIAFITNPTGGGNKSLNVIKDGVKPAVGSSDNNQQYDTYAGGGARPNDWIGYSFSSSKLFTRVVFQEGRNFYDGGAFSSVTVQVRSSGVWTNVTGFSSSPTYSGLNGVSYETFTLTFNPVSGDGIRISGAPAGAAQFVSVAELEVYGSDQGGPPPNMPPSASAGADQNVSIGANVTLNGSGSDPEGAAISYQWSQIGGAAVTLNGGTTATPSFTAPGVETTLTFQLITSDGVQSSAADTVDVIVTNPATANLASQGTPIAFITAPTGGGNKDLSVIKDGVKPAVGSSNSAQQYDTYNGGGPRTSDWIGYTFTSTKQFNRVVFQEGRNFYDGGAFANLTVQVRIGGVWTDVTGLSSTPTYSGLNGVSFESFSMTFTPVSGDGIRVYGAPGGAAKFVSIAELEVYGE